MQCFPSWDKNFITICYQMVTNTIEKWLPFGGPFGSHLQLLSIPHNWYGKETPKDCLIHNLPNVTHLFDRKDIIVESIKSCKNLKRRMRLQKIYDSACRTINFSTGMGLSFEHTKEVGARVSEKKIMEHW